MNVVVNGPSTDRVIEAMFGVDDAVATGMIVSSMSLAGGKGREELLNSHRPCHLRG